MLRSTRERLTLRRFAMMLLLTGAAIPVHADTGTTDGGTQAVQPGHSYPGDIIVTGQRIYDLRAERDLDETAIESYGANTSTNCSESGPRNPATATIRRSWSTASA